MNERRILDALKGHKDPNLQVLPKIVKIFVACSKDEFVGERRILLECIGPDLQKLFKHVLSEVQIVDIHYGTDSWNCIDPLVVIDHLTEIEESNKYSASCFFMVLIGDKYGPPGVPPLLEHNDFTLYMNKAKELNLNSQLLEDCYYFDELGYIVKPFRSTPMVERIMIFRDLINLLFECFMHLPKSVQMELEENHKSIVEVQFKCARQFEHLYGRSRIVAVKRILKKPLSDDNESTVQYYSNQINNELEDDDFDGDDKTGVNHVKYREYFQQQNENFHKYLNENVPNENILVFEASCNNDDDNYILPSTSNGFVPKEQDHTYLNTFQTCVYNKLRRIIEIDLCRSRPLKSQNQIVQEIFEENQTHLTLYEVPHLKHSDKLLLNTNIVHKFRKIVRETVFENKHSPILIRGDNGCGKTNLIQFLYRQLTTWLPNQHIIRMIRYINVTPRSSYIFELLFTICEQICITLNLFEELNEREQICYNMNHLLAWFNLLLQYVHKANVILVIFLDDIHLLSRFNLNDSTHGIHMWLPVLLPQNVLIVCTSVLNMNELKLSKWQKDKINLYHSYLEYESTALFPDFIRAVLNEAEERFGYETITRFLSLMSYSIFGVTEMEILTITMPIDVEYFVNEIDLGEFHLNFTLLTSLKRFFELLLDRKMIGNRFLYRWRHEVTKLIASDLYTAVKRDFKLMHNEYAHTYFSEFLPIDMARLEMVRTTNMITNDILEDGDDEEDYYIVQYASAQDSTMASTSASTLMNPSQYPYQIDIPYRQYHFEESWLHFLYANNIDELKLICLCNFDFLLTAIQSFSLNYLMCMLDYAHQYVLDHDIEMIHTLFEKIGNILLDDPLQFAPQLIAFLRRTANLQITLNCYNPPSSIYMDQLITSAMAWCDGYPLPILVPLNIWLPAPLPLEARTLNVPNVKQFECSLMEQFIVTINDQKLDLYHIMSETIIQTFSGHTGRILCTAFTKSAKLLLSAGEDLTMILWDLTTLSQLYRIQYHIAYVTCLITDSTDTLFISGGEDATICIGTIENGELLMKIEHHRDVISDVKTAHLTDIEILFSSSEDHTICMWSLKDYTLLNTIHLNAPVTMIDISKNYAFLVCCCTNSYVYLYAIATGTKLTQFTQHNTEVLSMCLNERGTKVILAGNDRVVYIYDTHNGNLINTLHLHRAKVTCVRITCNDDYLITCGGGLLKFHTFKHCLDVDERRIIWQSKKFHRQFNGTLQLYQHRSYITQIAISRDGRIIISGDLDGLVNLWFSYSRRLFLSFLHHTDRINCLDVSNNTFLFVSGSEDGTVCVWDVVLGCLVCNFKLHKVAVASVVFLIDSERIASSDRSRIIMIWDCEDGILLQSFNGPFHSITMSNNMGYLIATDGNSLLTIWRIFPQNKVNVKRIKHSNQITCYMVTMNSEYLITGSQDQCLKMWQLNGTKLCQIFSGHTGGVTCVTMSLTNTRQIVSGSEDHNLIIWDIVTGQEVAILTGHTNCVTCVKASGDGSIICSGSTDMNLIIWDWRTALPLTKLNLHDAILDVVPTSDFMRIAVLLKNQCSMPILRLYNTPAHYVRYPSYCLVTKNIMEVSKPLRGPRPMKRLLKDEVSLDAYMWQKKYGYFLEQNLKKKNERYLSEHTGKSNRGKKSKQWQDEAAALPSEEPSTSQNTNTSSTIRSQIKHPAQTQMEFALEIQERWERFRTGHVFELKPVATIRIPYVGDE